MTEQLGKPALNAGDSGALGGERVDAINNFLRILANGYWKASIYHAPPSRKYPRGGIMCGTVVSLAGQYPDRESALLAAQSAIAAGRVSIGTFIHGPSATPYTRFVLGQEHIEAMAIYAQEIAATNQEPTP